MFVLITESAKGDYSVFVIPRKIKAKRISGITEEELLAMKEDGVLLK